MNAALVDSAISEPAEEFKRVVLELGIADPEAIETAASGQSSGLPELMRSLIQAQVLTAYQARAIEQGKARGLVISRYLILDKLGEGGMGVVFKARHRVLNRLVALKILPPSFARNEELVLRFRREMHACARLNHPNVVAVLDADEDRGVYFLAMEYIEGRDLDHLIREHGPLPVEEALECTVQAARGLEAAHARGIVHRDIKPANLMLDASGTVRVLDLGLARLLGDSSPAGSSTPHHLTRPGVYMGTVDFMAPEQAEDSHNVDHRADIYSLGCSLYFLLTGRPPFEGTTAISRLMAHQSEPPPSIRKTRPELPATLEAVYLAMMGKRPDDRPQSMADVIARLISCRSSSVVDVHLSIESFSSTVVEKNALVRAALDPTIFRGRDSSGGTRIEAQLDFEDGGPADRSGELTRTEDEPACLERSGSGLFSKHIPHRPRRMAAVCVSAVLVSLGLIYVAAMWRGGGRHGAAAPPRTSTTPPDVASAPTGEPSDSSSRPPETPNPASEEVAVNAPKKMPEPPPPEAAVDRAAPSRKTARDSSKPKAATIPSFNVAPIFARHKGPVNAIAVTGDGKLALSAGADHSVRLWEVATGKQVLELPPHPSPVLDIAMTPDGVFALTVTRGRPNTNGAIRLWNLRTRQPVMNGIGQSPHTGSIQGVAFVPNNRALTGGHDGHAILWNLRVGRPIGKLGASQNGVVRMHALAAFPDGRRALTGGEDGIVHVWNLGTRAQSAQWSGHEGPISDLALSDDGRRAVTASRDHTVILWDAVHSSRLRRFRMPGEDRPKAVAILPDGNVLAAGLLGHVILWDASTGAILRQAQPPFTPHDELIVLPPDARQFLTADQDGVVRIWTVREP